MDEVGNALFNEYVLDLLAHAEKQRKAIDALIREVGARATAADLRLSDVEKELCQFQDALTKHMSMCDRTL